MQQQEKRFIPDPKPFKENRICSFYRVTDQKNERFFAKSFIEDKLYELKVYQSTEFNQTLLSDLSDQIYPEQFLMIKHTYGIQEGFIFVTDQYETTLEQFLKGKVIEEKEALSIFSQVTKANYSLYNAGFRHRNVRPQHFVKIGNTWKIESLVLDEQYMDSNGLDSEYLWNPAYQPPEAYGKSGFSQEELDQMIVWNAGSLLLDLLLSVHKLKDKSIIDRFKDQPFSFKAIGVKRKFSAEISELLSKMLHYNPQKRMKVDQYFGNSFVCAEVAAMQKSHKQKPKVIYMGSQSSLSQSLSNTGKLQQSITGKGFARKNKYEQTMNLHISNKNGQTIDNSKQLMETIKNITKRNLLNELSPISEASNQSQVVRKEKISEMLLNPLVSKAVQVYKCHYDKCELLMIAIGKLEKVEYKEHEVEAILLNQFAVTFVSLMQLHALAESMNQNLNFFDLDPELWSEFQSTNQFKGFKQIMNYRILERRDLLNPIQQKIKKLKSSQRDMMNCSEVDVFLHAKYKRATFETVKSPYRKILKKTYDIITREYNTYKTRELASMGMYITYCMTVDKLYIPEHIQDNFGMYFAWMKIEPTAYVPLDQFQGYLDNADRKILVKHSVQILKKYFTVHD